MAETASQASAREYEELVRDLIGRLAGDAPVTTLRLQRDVELQGRANPIQVDVLWDFMDAEGHGYRLLFEARSYRDRIKQDALHAWRSKVDDVTEPSWNYVGLMVTTTGYQRGAKRVAETYGVVVLELREPTEKDLSGRIEKIIVNMTAVIPRVTGHSFEFVELLTPDEPTVSALSSDMEVETVDGRRQRLDSVLLAGEIGPIDNPETPLHPVRKTFDPPATLFVEGRPRVRIRAVEATVGQSASELPPIVVGGRETLSYMLKNTLNGAHIWFGVDGRVWSTD